MTYTLLALIPILYTITILPLLDVVLGYDTTVSLLMTISLVFLTQILIYKLCKTLINTQLNRSRLTAYLTTIQLICAAGSHYSDEIIRLSANYLLTEVNNTSLLETPAKNALKTLFIAIATNYKPQQVYYTQVIIALIAWAYLRTPEPNNQNGRFAAAVKGKGDIPVFLLKTFKKPFTIAIFLVLPTLPSLRSTTTQLNVLQTILCCITVWAFFDAIAIWCGRSERRRQRFAMALAVGTWIQFANLAICAGRLYLHTNLQVHQEFPIEMYLKSINENWAVENSLEFLVFALLLLMWSWLSNQYYKKWEIGHWRDIHTETTETLNSFLFDGTIAIFNFFMNPADFRNKHTATAKKSNRSDDLVTAHNDRDADEDWIETAIVELLQRRLDKAYQLQVRKDSVYLFRAKGENARPVLFATASASETRIRNEIAKSLKNYQNNAIVILCEPLISKFTPSQGIDSVVGVHDLVSDIDITRLQKAIRKISEAPILGIAGPQKQRLNLYNTFVPPFVNRLDINGDFHGRNISAEELIQTAANTKNITRQIFVGDYGQGKTSLAVCTIRKILDNMAERTPLRVPIFVNLANMPLSILTLNQVLFIIHDEYSMSPSVIRFLRENGLIHFIFDAVDEMVIRTIDEQTLGFLVDKIEEISGNAGYTCFFRPSLLPRPSDSLYKVASGSSPSTWPQHRFGLLGFTFRQVEELLVKCSAKSSEEFLTFMRGSSFRELISRPAYVSHAYDAWSRLQGLSDSKDGADVLGYRYLLEMLRRKSPPEKQVHSITEEHLVKITLCYALLLVRGRGRQQIDPKHSDLGRAVSCAMSICPPLQEYANVYGFDDLVRVAETRGIFVARDAASGGVEFSFAYDFLAAFLSAMVVSSADGYTALIDKGLARQIAKCTAFRRRMICRDPQCLSFYENILLNSRSNGPASRFTRMVRWFALMHLFFGLREFMAASMLHTSSSLRGLLIQCGHYDRVFIVDAVEYVFNLFFPSKAGEELSLATSERLIQCGLFNLKGRNQMLSGMRLDRNRFSTVSPLLLIFVLIVVHMLGMFWYAAPVFVSLIIASLLVHSDFLHRYVRFRRIRRRITGARHNHVFEESLTIRSVVNLGFAYDKVREAIGDSIS